jgi:outer membrane lipoprotein-sorting protein
MKNKLCLILLALGLAARAACGAPDDKLVDEWIAGQASAHSWKADFRQIRELKALTQPLVATGKIWWVAPHSVRWEVMKPAPSIAVMEDDTLLVVFPKLKRGEKYSLAQLKTGPWKDLLGLLDTGFPRSRAEFEQQFLIRDVVAVPGGRRMIFQPKSALVQKYMPEVDIDVRMPDLALLATTMVFVDGSHLKNEFSNQERDAQVDDALFHPTLGPDYKITEPLSGVGK